jgi:hypothetical protein
MQRLVPVGVPALSALLIAGTARADDWVLRRDTSSNACRVELATAPPIGVIQIAGPFTWTADPDKIIAAVRRGHQVLDSIH